MKFPVANQWQYISEPTDLSHTAFLYTVLQISAILHSYEKLDDKA